MTHSNPETLTLLVEGMMCPHCQARVEKALNDLEGVTAQADFQAGTATVTCTGKVDRDALAKAVTEAGYTVTGFREE